MTIFMYFPFGFFSIIIRHCKDVNSVQKNIDKIQVIISGEEWSLLKA